MNYSTNSTVDFEALRLETITLGETEVNQAIKLSSQVQKEGQRWQTYLNTLALFGFEQWLGGRAPEIDVEQEKCSVFQPPYANVIPAVFNLKVGEFKLCLMARGSLTDDAIAFPRAVIDLPEFVAHFYVILEVTEELEQVTIQGFIRYDELIEQASTVKLPAETDWTYQLPLAWFESNPDKLLLYLRCLEPAAITLPTIPQQTSAALPELQAKFSQLLPQLQSPDCELWQVLTWEEGAALLTNAELLDKLVAIPQEETVTPTEKMLQLIKEPIVNVGRWLQDEMDEFTQQLDWVLLPAFSPEVVPLRSPTQELEAILKQLERQGKNIPTIARGAYQDFQLAKISLRLYAVTWICSSPENLPEWTLLLILGAQPGTKIPQVIKLLLSDETEILLERVLEPHTEETYIYAQVVGTWEEEFNVTITSQDTSLTLPAFAFRPN